MKKIFNKILKDKNDDLKYEFMPAALEIIERPPSPLGSTVLWTIFAMIITTIIWSVIGKVDEVAVARGKVVPDGRLKVIQPLEQGIVLAIHVTEGQKVKEGELLIELDSTMSGADLEVIEKSMEMAKLEKEIFNLYLNNKNMRRVNFISKLGLKYLNDYDIDSQKSLIKAKDIEYKQKIETYKSIIKQKKGELEISKTKLTSLNKKYQTAVKEETSLRKLHGIGSISRKKWLNKKNEVFSLKQDKKGQNSVVKNASEKIKEARQNMASVEKSRKSDTLASIVDREKKIIGYEAQLTKVRKKFELQKLYSPVDGIINGLALATIGGVVSPAEPILTIVPENTPLTVEVMILNKDVGFINVGQEAEIKLDTFPFQKYGSIEGEVVNISPDAFGDEESGLRYKVKIRPKKDYLVINGKKVKLSSGMALNSEIKTGRRRIIEFFLSPLQKFSQESFELR